MPRLRPPLRPFLSARPDRSRARGSANLSTLHEDTDERVLEAVRDDGSGRRIAVGTSQDDHWDMLVVVPPRGTRGSETPRVRARAHAGDAGSLSDGISTIW